jgi:hypothetical protein
MICLVAAPFAIGQTRDRRLDDALGEITALKRIVKEQDRRIAALEKASKPVEIPAAVSLERFPADDRVKIRNQPAVAIPWQTVLAWSQIKAGMSRVQVEEILGPPTSVDSVIDSQILNYKGDLPGTGSLAATVKLTDDRVAQVTPPEF